MTIKYQRHYYQNGKITIHNDKKEKYDSWTARVYVNSNISEGNINLELVVYEDTKEEWLAIKQIDYELKMIQSK